MFAGPSGLAAKAKADGPPGLSFSGPPGGPRPTSVTISPGRRATSSQRRDCLPAKTGRCIQVVFILVLRSPAPRCDRGGGSGWGGPATRRGAGGDLRI